MRDESGLNETTSSPKSDLNSALVELVKTSTLAMQALEQSSQAMMQVAQAVQAQNLIIQDMMDSIAILIDQNATLIESLDIGAGEDGEQRGTMD